MYNPIENRNHMIAQDVKKLQKDINDIKKEIKGMHQTMSDLLLYLCERDSEKEDKEND